MNYKIPEDNKEKMENTNGEIQEKSNESEYCECNDTISTLKKSNDNKNKLESNEAQSNKNIHKEEEKILNNGEILVTSILDCGEQNYLQGVKINLYKINGLSPVLIESQITDEEGKVLFSQVEKGCYRIIEIIDKKYFEKPKYINWNEIIIDDSNKRQKVVIINRVKRFISQNKHKSWI